VLNHLLLTRQFFNLARVKRKLTQARSCICDTEAIYQGWIFYGAFSKSKWDFVLNNFFLGSILLSIFEELGGRHYFVLQATRHVWGEVLRDYPKKDSKSSTFLVIDPAVWMIGRTTGPFSPGVDSYYKRLHDKHKIRNNYLNKSWICIQFRKEPRPKQEHKWNAPVSSDKLHLGFRSRKREQSECWRARLKGLDKMGQYRRIGFKNRQGTNCFWSSFRQIAWHLATI